MMRVLCMAVMATALVATARARQPSGVLVDQVDRLAQEIGPQVITWRRDFHQHPELGKREMRTAKVIADELRRLGYDVRTGVAHAGVVAVLRAGSRARSWRCAPTWTRFR